MQILLDCSQYFVHKQKICDKDSQDSVPVSEFSVRGRVLEVLVLPAENFRAQDRRHLLPQPLEHVNRPKGSDETGCFEYHYIS